MRLGGSVVAAPKVGWLFLTSLVLVLIGLVFIYSSSSVFALESHGSAAYFVCRQLFGVGLGLIGLIIGWMIPTEQLRKLSPYLFLISLGFTVLTLLPGFGMHIHGSSRWLRLPGLSLQPSEFLKIALIIYVAYLLDQKKFQKQSFWGSFVPLSIVFGLTAGVLLQQPDFGLAVVLGMTVFMLLLIARFSGEYLLGAMLLLAPAVGLLIWLKPYRLKRILVFLNPWNDPRGAGFQIIQSLIAVGSGGWWGLGVGGSRQKFFYLPMQHTDFIFAIISEEVGFIGATALVMIYLFWMYFGMRLAWQMSDQFATYMTLGFVILISLQALINLCVVTGLFPTKGVGLPFVSYGCSGLISNLTMLGVIARSARKSV